MEWLLGVALAVSLPSWRSGGTETADTERRRYEATTMKLAGLILGLAAVFSHSEALAQEQASRLFPDAATACFAAGIPPREQLNPLSDITSLIVRPRDPETDGDGDYPPAVERKLGPAGPNEILLTLMAPSRVMNNMHSRVTMGIPVLLRIGQA